MSLFAYACLAFLKYNLTVFLFFNDHGPTELIIWKERKMFRIEIMDFKYSCDVFLKAKE